MRTAPRSSVSSSITRIFGILCRRRSVQHLTDLSRQRLRRERFLEEGRARGEDALIDDRRVRVSGEIQHSHVAMRRGEEEADFAAAHPGHYNIRYEQVNVTGVALGEPEGLRTTRRDEHAVPPDLEQPLCEPPNPIPLP